MVRLLAFVALVLCGVGTAFAQLNNENLLVPPPEGFKLGYQNKTDRALIAEWVPDGQTVENWSEMVTHQIFFNLKAKPADFKARMDGLWSQACPGAKKSAVIAEDVENGYPTLIWLMACESNPKTGKPEITWFKALAGNDSLYVKKAFKFMPSQEQNTASIKYLQQAKVCDTRLPDRPCLK